MSYKGRENAYLCDTCHGYTTTVDIDDGVTPATVACRASGQEDECGGIASSLGYPSGPRPEQISAPSWEWYRPDELEQLNLDAETWEHVKRGGLLLRKVQP